MSAAPRVRVLIVDDHPVVRFGLAAIISLQPDMDVAGEAGSGEEACTICAERAARRRADGPAAARPERRRGDPDDPRRRTRPPLHRAHDLRRRRGHPARAGRRAPRPTCSRGCRTPTSRRRSARSTRAAASFRSRSRRRSPSSRPHSQLSPREVEVLELIANGFSNKEIGRALGITEATVKWHVNLILQPARCRRPHRGHRRGPAARHHPPALTARLARRDDRDRR